MERSLRGTEGITVIQGEAHFVGPRDIEVNGAQLQAPQLFINVGGRPTLPDIPGLAQAHWLTSDTVMDIETVPADLLVLGGSYVGLEFAQMFHRFGAEVTLFEAGSRLIGREDQEISDAVKSILEAEGIQVRLGAAKCEVETVDGGVAIRPPPPATRRDRICWWPPGGGRTPTGLGLDRAGIATDQRGYIVTDEMLRTNVADVWALGDCNGRGAFTHTSYTEADIVAEPAGRRGA